jgi:hypothetical protein
MAAPDDPRFADALRRFAEVHAEDPQRVVTDRGTEPLAVAHHRRVAHWVDALLPSAPPALRLAAGCQHLGRHRMPRSEFPEGVLGYKKWRTTAARRQAELADALLLAAGWEAPTRARVSELLTKKGLGRDAEVQVLEDAVCLTFLELELEGFARKHPAEKVDDILKKTWAKMSPAGHAAALAMLGAATGEVAVIAARVGPSLSARGATVP